MLYHPFKVFGLQVGDAHMLHHSFLAELHQCGQSLVDNLIEVGKLNIVNINQVDVVNVETLHALVDTVGYALGRIVPGVDAVLAVASHLCRKIISVTLYFLQGFSQYHLGLVMTVIWRYVYKVNSVVNCRMDCFYAL